MKAASAVAPNQEAKGLDKNLAACQVNQPTVSTDSVVPTLPSHRSGRARTRPLVPSSPAGFEEHCFVSRVVLIRRVPAGFNARRMQHGLQNNAILLRLFPQQP
jgi:hypothetical protein